MRRRTQVLKINFVFNLRSEGFPNKDGFAQYLYRESKSDLRETPRRNGLASDTSSGRGTIVFYRPAYRHRFTRFAAICDSSAIEFSLPHTLCSVFAKFIDHRRLAFPEASKNTDRSLIWLANALFSGTVAPRVRALGRAPSKSAELRDAAKEEAEPRRNETIARPPSTWSKFKDPRSGGLRLLTAGLPPSPLFT